MCIRDRIRSLCVTIRIVVLYFSLISFRMHMMSFVFVESSAPVGSSQSRILRLVDGEIVQDQRNDHPKKPEDIDWTGSEGAR